MADLTEGAVFATLLPIFREVLDESDIELTRDSNARNLPNWDSLAHLEIMELVQRRSKVKFSLSDLEKLKNVGDLVDLIISKSAK